MLQLIAGDQLGTCLGSFAYCPELKCREPGPDRTGKRPSLLFSDCEKGKLLGELESAMRADFSLKLGVSGGTEAHVAKKSKTRALSLRY